MDKCIVCDVIYFLQMRARLVPTSNNWCGWGAQGVTWFTASLLKSEGVELQLCSIQELFGLLMQSHLCLQLPLCIHQLNL